MRHELTIEERLGASLEPYRHCMLCEHRCGADRTVAPAGRCKAGAWPRLYRHRIEYGEETAIVPTHEFYLSGCDLRCAFCIAGIDAFDARRGNELTQEWFDELVNWGIVKGARNVQWVGGEPTIHVPALVELMKGCKRLPEVVWKSDFHFTPEALAMLDGLVGIYVADFKFGNDACAKRLAECSDYVRIVTRNLKLARSQGRLIVRHLLMPGHVECCLVPVARWMKEKMPEVEFSLRDGYLPSWRAQQFVELRGPVSRAEERVAAEVVKELELKVIQ